MSKTPEVAGHPLRNISRRAATVFASEGWRWYIGAGAASVPDAEEIERTLLRLLADPRILGDKENAPGGSGRLVLYSDGNGGVTIALKLGTLSPEEVEAL